MPAKAFSAPGPYCIAKTPGGLPFCTREQPSAMCTPTRSWRQVCGRLPGATAASMIGVVGKQNRVETPSRLRISEIASMTCIVSLPWILSGSETLARVRQRRHPRLSGGVHACQHAAAMRAGGVADVIAGAILDDLDRLGFGKAEPLAELFHRLDLAGRQRSAREALLDGLAQCRPAQPELIEKAYSDHRREERERRDADNRYHPAHNLAERGLRDEVAVTDRGQRLDRPPHRRRDRAEPVRLSLAFDHVHKRGADRQRQQQDERHHP